MACKPLDNYLRTHRKKAGLSQAEASRLVGLKNRFQFARYERHQCEPPYWVALACEQLFGVPNSLLFAGFSTAVAKGTRRRVRAFERGLAGRSTALNLGRLRHKLQWLVDCVARLGHLAYVT